ncbi:MAG TPA: DUF6597 domain-containing transcriptional factor [Egibacteraceae bacterium]
MSSSATTRRHPPTADSATGPPTTPAALLGPIGGYGERPPLRAPQEVVACLWAAALPRQLPPLRVVPDGCVDLIADGRRVWVAGPDSTAAVEHLTPGTTLVGVRLRPGTAGSVLGLPAAELRDQRVPLGELAGFAAEPLAERLHRHLGEDGDSAAAAAALEDVVIERLASAPPIDRAVTGLVARLAAAPPGATPSVAALAHDLGYSERQLLRRCTAAIGYGPTILARILRFQRFLDAAARSPGRSLAALAADAGYADQAHLAHETQRLAGVPPSALLPPGRRPPTPPSPDRGHRTTRPPQTREVSDPDKTAPSPVGEPQRP